MKNIYFIFLMIICANIQAQEKQIDWQNIPTTLQDNSTFNQYFTAQGWDYSSDEQNIYFETKTQNEASVYAIKSKNQPNVFLLTAEAEVAAQWQEDIKSFATFAETKSADGQDVFVYQYNNANYGWYAEVNPQTRLYTFFVVLAEDEVVDSSKGQPRLKDSELEIGKYLARQFRADASQVGNYSGEVTFVVTEKGKVKDVKTTPYNKYVQNEIERILKGAEWIPGVDENQNPIEKTINFPFNIKVN